ncbi:MAG TPA: hypothetical protein VLW50_00085 [Streptosporangiaceae bacterium]|nr:hypothetical protein [Streptosporangiaceae bacterium]
MRLQFVISAAVTTITRTITVAAGVFDLGHPGELTWQVPFELVDAVLEETGARERRPWAGRGCRARRRRRCETCAG